LVDVGFFFLVLLVDMYRLFINVLFVFVFIFLLVFFFFFFLGGGGGGGGVYLHNLYIACA